MSARVCVSLRVSARVCVYMYEEGRGEDGLPFWDQSGPSECCSLPVMM